MSEKLSKQELIELGHRLLNAKTEEESDELYNEFNSHFVHPDAANLFYYPENWNARKDDGSNYEPTVEEVVEQALAYKPIIL